MELFSGLSEIKPDELIGTKWTGWSDLFEERIFIQFVDKLNCIYTSRYKKYQLTYNITKGQLYISNITGAFELRGDVLFNNDLPVFEKAA